MNNLYDGLAEVLLSLLKNTETRQHVLEYLAEVINKNSSRAHIQVFYSPEPSFLQLFIFLQFILSKKRSFVDIYILIYWGLEYIYIYWRLELLDDLSIIYFVSLA